jgi:hypothetical protein
MYSAEMGRFLAVDPMFETMPRYTPYHYAFNSPLMWRDPSGLVPQKEKNREKLQGGLTEYIPNYVSQGCTVVASRYEDEISFVFTAGYDCNWGYGNSFFGGNIMFLNSLGGGGGGGNPDYKPNPRLTTPFTGAIWSDEAKCFIGSSFWHDYLTENAKKSASGSKGNRVWSPINQKESSSNLFNDAKNTLENAVEDVGKSMDEAVTKTMNGFSESMDIAVTKTEEGLRGLVINVGRETRELAQDLGNFVYISLTNNGEVQYVGITNDIARREAEHLTSTGIRIRALLQGLSRSDTRAVEQVLIEIHGLGKNGGTLLYNKINSISAYNFNYSNQLRRGYELLRQIGYK